MTFNWVENRRRPAVRAVHQGHLYVGKTNGRLPTGRPAPFVQPTGRIPAPWEQCRKQNSSAPRYFHRADPRSVPLAAQKKLLRQPREILGRAKTHSGTLHRFNHDGTYKKNRNMGRLYSVQIPKRKCIVFCACQLASRRSTRHAATRSIAGFCCWLLGCFSEENRPDRCKLVQNSNGAEVVSTIVRGS